MTPSVLVERAGHVTTVLINRPEARVAVLDGVGGTLCAGADPKARSGRWSYAP